MPLSEKEKKARKAESDRKYRLNNKDRLREKQRLWAKKNYHANKIKCLANHKQYWANTTDERKAKRKVKNLQYTHNFRQQNPEAAKRYYRNAKQKWTNGVDCMKKEIWQKAESVAIDFVKTKLLHKDVYQARFSQFVFDFMSWHNKNLYAFQVTTLRTRAIRRRHIELAKYLKAKFILINVKPTFDMLYIQELDNDLNFKTKRLQTNAIYGKKYFILTDTSGLFSYIHDGKK